MMISRTRFARVTKAYEFANLIHSIFPGEKLVTINSGDGQGHVFSISSCGSVGCQNHLRDRFLLKISMILSEGGRVRIKQYLGLQGSLKEFLEKEYLISFSQKI